MAVPSTDWIRGLPKAEIHLHLEGCLTFEDPPAFAGLGEFLDYLDEVCAGIDAAASVEQIAYDVAVRIGTAGTRYADLIFNPTHWPAWTDRLDDFVGALDRGFAAAEGEGAPIVALCASVGRHQSDADACALAEWAVGAKSARLVGLSIDGNEAALGRTSARFADAFAIARQGGLRRAVHAGESSGPEGVRDAIDLLDAERIDHGVRAAEDPALVADLAARGTPLAICPTSNISLGLYASIAKHPIERLRTSGVVVCVNTDDPLLFGCDLVGEYALCAEAFGWGEEIVAELARASIRSSFAPAELKQRLLLDVDDYVTRERHPEG